MTYISNLGSGYDCDGCGKVIQGQRPDGWRSFPLHDTASNLDFCSTACVDRLILAVTKFLNEWRSGK